MSKCKVCNNNVNNLFYIGTELMFGTGEEFLYFKCSKCGCLQIETIPDDMSQYYPDNYYSYSTEIKAKAIKSEIVDFLLKNAIAARLGKKI